MSLSILAAHKCLNGIKEAGYTRLEDWIRDQKMELVDDFIQTLEKTDTEFQKQNEHFQYLMNCYLKEDPTNPLRACLKDNPEEDKITIVQDYLSKNLNITNPALEHCKAYFTYLTADDPLKMACEDKKNESSRIGFISNLIKYQNFYHIDTKFSKRVEKKKFSKAKDYLDKIPKEIRADFILNNGKTMLFLAVEMNDEKLVDEILECFSKEDFFTFLMIVSKSRASLVCNALHIAISKGNLNIVNKILDKIPQEKIPELLQFRINDTNFSTIFSNKIPLQLAIDFASYNGIENNFKILREILLRIQKLPLEEQKEHLSANTLIELASFKTLTIGGGTSAENFRIPRLAQSLIEILDNISPYLQLHLLSAKDKNGGLPIELFIDMKNEEAVEKILEVIDHFSDEDKKKCLSDRVLLALTAWNMNGALKKIIEILPKDRIVEGLKIKVNLRREADPSAPVVAKNCLWIALESTNEELAFLLFTEILKLHDSDRKECISTDILYEALYKKMTNFANCLLIRLQDSEESKKTLTQLLKYQVELHGSDVRETFNALRFAVLAFASDEQMALAILNIIKSLPDEDKRACLLETTLHGAVRNKKLNVAKLIFEIAPQDVLEKSLHPSIGVNTEDGEILSETYNVMQEAIKNADEEMIRLIWTKSQDLSEDCTARLKRDIIDYEDMTDLQLKTLLKVVPVEIFEDRTNNILKITAYYKNKDNHNDDISRIKTLLEAICKLDDADQKITKYLHLNWLNQNMRNFKQSKDFIDIFMMLPDKSRLSYLQHNNGKLNLLENAFLSNANLIAMLLKEIEALEGDQNKATCLFDEKKGYSAFFQLLQRGSLYLDNLLEVFKDLSDEVKLDWLRVRNSASGQTALHYAMGIDRVIRKPVVLRLIDAIPQDERGNLLLIENKKHKSAWDIADFLRKEILEKLSANDKKMVLEKSDDRVKDSRLGKKARKESKGNRESASSSSSSATSSSSAGGLPPSAGKRRRREDE